MVDIARVFSPVVVLESSEAQPKSSDRIRSASTKRRLSSAETRRTPRVSSAVSTIEINNQIQGRYFTNVITNENDFERELKEELKTPLTGINLRGLINEKISKLDRALREVGATSDANQKKASLTSQKLRENAIRNVSQKGQSRQQVQQFVGLLATKAASETSASVTVNLDEDKDTALEQDKSTLLEIFKYPGFHEDHITPLPFHVVLETEVMRHILSKEYILSKQAPHIKSLIQLYHSSQTKALILDIFWWIFLDNYQNQPDIQKKLLARASNNYISLLMMNIDIRYRDKCFQVYPSLLAETVFACFKVCFPTSIKRMPVDTDAANKTKKENEDRPSELPNTFGQSSKELVNLDSFKNSIANICQLWIGGIPAPPRRYEQWRSKIVQQEKISFIEPTVESTGHQSSLHNHNMNETKHETNENVPQILLERRKHKEPQERLRTLYKTTNDPLPDRRVLFEDYRFNINGYSPLTEKYLRSRHMLKKAGTQFFISHPQISQVPTVEAETYEKEIQRTAQFCRIVRAQKHKERAEEDNHRKLIRKHVEKLRTQDELKKQQKQASIYRRKMMNFFNDDVDILSQSSVNSYE